MYFLKEIHTCTGVLLAKTFPLNTFFVKVTLKFETVKNKHEF